ncbi:MAG: hypothetical protein ABSA02_16610 [Trebonia sp.]
MHAHTGSHSQAELIREYENREPNSLQLARLADLAGVPVAGLERKSIATLKNELLINPILFEFELVCGQVVKVDPVTGLKYPVTGATVTVNDLQCDWLWFFPPGWPWSWGFRWPRCVSVPIGSVQTGPCGEFCILIPRWDIEWIRIWIQERWCFPEILKRPSVADLLAPQLPGAGAPNRPDPAALASLLDAREDLAAAIGPAALAAIRDAGRTQTLGALTTGLSDVLAANAFTRPVPAPVPAELRALSPAQARESFSARLSLRPTGSELDLSLPFGPFLRCVDVEVPIWIPFFEVPDINFVVTQQIGGTDQVIYDGAFDAAWDTWPAPLQVELDVAQSAVASPVPGCPPQGIECEDEPAIVSIGLLDVAPADGYLDPGGSGFAVLMNKPNAMPDTPSTAPFESVVSGYLPLYGCAAGAEFYRVMASSADSDGLTTLEADGSMTPLPASAFGPATPVIAPQPWQVAPLTGPPSPRIVPDVNGWYRSTYLTDYPQNLLVNWAPSDGVYRLTVETGTGTAGSVTPTGVSSPPVVVVVDNSPPSVTFWPAGWKYASSSGPFMSFTEDDGCFIIERSGQDIEIQLSYTVTAYHLYSICLVPDGCAVGDVTVTDSGGLAADVCPGGLGYIYDGPFDNSLPDSSLTGTVTYTIAGDAPDGCYSWTLWAYSRAFSPNASQGLTDVGGSAWNYVQTPIYANPSLSIAVVTE